MATGQPALTAGAIGGLFLLLWCDSAFLGILAGGIWGWCYLIKWLQGSECTSQAKLDGKVVVVTGANTGIGKETARLLALRGARVILACRNMAKAEAAAADIIQQTGGTANIECHQLDLASFKSVRKFAKELAARESRVDILVNNAGIMFAPREVTEDGQELTMQSCHFGHFLLTNLLVDLLKAAGNARVVTVSSLAHKWAKHGISWDDLKWENSWSAFTVYGEAKLANILFSRELSTRLRGSGITTYSLHPGAIDTDLSRHFMARLPAFLVKHVQPLMKYFIKTPEQGAQTTLHCCIDERLAGQTGKYYSDCAEVVPSKQALDDDAAKKLWSVSEEVVGDIFPVVPTGHTPNASEEKLRSKEDGGAEYLFQEFSTSSVQDVASQKEFLKDIENFEGESLSSVGFKEPMSGSDIAKQEMNRSNLMKDVVEEVSGLDLTHVTPKEPVSASELMKQELGHAAIVKSVETFEKTELKKTETREPISGEELLKQEMGHHALVEGVENFERTELKQTDVVEKSILPDAQTLKEEKDKFDLLKGVEDFETSDLIHVSTKESLSGVELLKQELTLKALNESVETFEKGDLKQTDIVEKNSLPDNETIKAEKNRSDFLRGVEEFEPSDLTPVKMLEPASGADVAKQELTHKSMVESVEAFDHTALKHSIPQEKDSLPDAQTIKSERERFDLLKGVEEFSSADLTPVKTNESLSGAALLKQELTHKAVTESVESFEKTGLKPTEVVEKNLLPDAETLQEERTRSDLLKGLEGFATSDLNPVKTPEPLSGVDLLKQEMTHKSVVEGVEGFDHTALNPSVTLEKDSLPDAETIRSERDRFDLLKGVEGFSSSDLSPVIPKEPLSGAELLKQELSHKAVVAGVINFEKDALKPTEVDERNVLPDAGTLEAEKQESEHFKGIGDFDSSSLKSVSTREPVSGPDLIRQESARTEISDQIQTFDRSELRETDIDEKVILPGADDIKTEKQHVEMLEGLEKGVELRHVETVGPTSPVDLAKHELARESMVDNIQEFDRSSLIPVTTEEKNILPSAEEMRKDESDDDDEHGGAAGLREVLLDTERGRRSSSEEWEKIGHTQHSDEEKEKNVSDC